MDRKHTAVKDIMIKNVLTIRVDAPFSRVEEIFRDHHIRHLPVVDKDNHLVGMVTQRDLYRVATVRKTSQGEVFEKGELNSFVLRHVMAPDPVTLGPDNSVANAVQLMAEHKYGAIPIVDEEHRVIGIVSQIDVLKFTHQWLMSEEEKSYMDTMYVRIRELESIFRVALYNLENSGRDVFPTLFLSRTHQSFAAAGRYAMSGQFKDSYLWMRYCLEDAMHGFYFHKNPKSVFTWLKRTEGKGDAGQQGRGEFNVRTMTEVLDVAEPALGHSARELYNRTLDYEAQPVDESAPLKLDANANESNFQFNVDYLLCDSPQVKACLNAGVEVGICTILIFKSIFQETFNNAGLTNKITQLCTRLIAP